MYNEKRLNSLIILGVFIAQLFSASVFTSKVNAANSESEEVNETQTTIQDQIAESSLIGDVNGDGNRNSIDFATMRTVLLGFRKSFSISNGTWAADTDGNGVFNSIDFAYMRMFLLGTIKEFPANEEEIPDNIDAVGAFDNDDIRIVIDKVNFDSTNRKFHIYGKANFNGKSVKLSVFDSKGGVTVADFIELEKEEEMMKFEAVANIISSEYYPESIIINIFDEEKDKMVRVGSVRL